MLFLVAQVGWFADVLGGGNSNTFSFSPRTLGEDFQFDEFVLTGLKPPTIFF